MYCDLACPEVKQGDSGEEVEPLPEPTPEPEPEVDENIGSQTVIDTTSSDILATKAPTYTSGEVQPGDFYHKEITKAIELLRELGFDEEADAINGTAKVVEELKNRDTPITWCIVGEPSSREQLGDVVRVGRRGSLNAILTIKGQQGPYCLSG